METLFGVWCNMFCLSTVCYHRYNNVFAIIRHGQQVKSLNQSKLTDKKAGIQNSYSMHLETSLLDKIFGSSNSKSQWIMLTDCGTVY